MAAPPSARRSRSGGAAQKWPIRSAGHRPEKDPEFLRNGLRLISRVPLEAGRGRPVHRYRNAVEIV